MMQTQWSSRFSVFTNIRIDLNEDISLATPTLILEPEVGTKLEITTGVTIPSSDVTVDGHVFSANEYVEYQTTATDLSYSPHWRYKCKLWFSDTDIRQTNYSRFTVLA